MNQLKLDGLIAATTTPFAEDRSLRLDDIVPMVDQLIASGVRGLYVCGSTGEGMSLRAEERRLVAEATISASGGRVPVIVQVGHNSLGEARKLAQHAEEAGADAVSATCPSYFKIGDVEILVQSMGDIASAAPGTPFYYYHIPALTGSSIDITEFMRRGGDRIATLAGLKYTNTLLHEFQSCMQVDPERFDVVWGCDEMLLGALATGAKAAIGSTYNVAAPLYLQVMSAFKNSDHASARELQFRSVEMVEVMKRFPFHAALKAMMQMLGMPGGPCRLPIENLDADAIDDLRQQLDQIGFFQWCGHEIN